MHINQSTATKVQNYHLFLLSSRLCVTNMENWIRFLLPTFMSVILFHFSDYGFVLFVRKGYKTMHFILLVLSGEDQSYKLFHPTPRFTQRILQWRRVSKTKTKDISTALLTEGCQLANSHKIMRRDHNIYPGS